MSLAQHVPFAAVVIEDLSCTAFFASDLTMMVSVSQLDDFCFFFCQGQIQTFEKGKSKERKSATSRAGAPEAIGCEEQKCC